MQRRRYISLAGVAATGILGGCSGGNESGGGGSTETSDPSPTATQTSETTTESATTANESGGLPGTAGNGTPGTATDEFTTSVATTPMDADTFVETLEGRIDTKKLSTAYFLETSADEQRVAITYVVDEDTQRNALEGFAESFVETVRRAGGTGGWILDMTVQTGAERNVWYTWTVKDEWAVQRLSGEISREEFYSKIEGSTTTPTPSGERGRSSWWSA